MRNILAFTLLVAGACASFVPEPSIGSGKAANRNSRFIISGPIEANVAAGIQEISQAIKDEGLDPFHIAKEHYDYELPVPNIFNAAAILEDILSTGLSNIVIEHLNFNVVLRRLDFILVLPHLHFSARVASGDATLFGDSLTAQADGRVDIRNTVIVGQVRVSVGIISGTTVSGVTVDFNLGRIASNIRLAIQGDNYSHEINDFIANTIPEVLEEFSDEINELFEIILLEAIEQNVDL